MRDKPTPKPVSSHSKMAQAKKGADAIKRRWYYTAASLFFLWADALEYEVHHSFWSIERNNSLSTAINAFVSVFGSIAFPYLAVKAWVLYFRSKRGQE